MASCGKPRGASSRRPRCRRDRHKEKKSSEVIPSESCTALFSWGTVTMEQRCCYGTGPSKESSSIKLLSHRRVLRMQLCCVWTKRVYSWCSFLYTTFSFPGFFFFLFLCCFIKTEQQSDTQLKPVDRRHHLCPGVRSITDQLKFKALNFKLSEEMPEVQSWWRSFSRPQLLP